MIRSRALEDDDDLEGFFCGEDSLDTWLRKSARSAAAKRVGRTFVWVDDDSSRVVAYYTLCAHVITKAQLPPRIGRGDPERIPAILLARLALDLSIQGMGHGAALLADAMSQVRAATESVAARYVVVEAISPEAAAFYRRFGFKDIDPPLSGIDMQGVNSEPTYPCRLVRKVSDIVAELAEAD